MTASTCCWPDTHTAARSASPAQARWSPTAVSRARWPAACTAIRPGSATPTRGCTYRPALVPRPMPRFGCVADRRLRCSRWYLGSARLLGRSAGCSAAWQRASFGTKRPPVQIRPPRPELPQVRCGADRWAYSDHVAAGVRDDQDRPIGGEVWRALDQIYAGLQDCAASSLDAHLSRDLLRGNEPGAVGNGVAEVQPSSVRNA